MYQYQKNGRHFTFFAPEDGKLVDVGMIQVMTVDGIIVDYEAEDLAGRLNAMVRKITSKALTIDQFELALLNANVTPR